MRVFFATHFIIFTYDCVEEEVYRCVSAASNLCMHRIHWITNRKKVIALKRSRNFFRYPPPAPIKLSKRKLLLAPRACFWALYFFECYFLFSNQNKIELNQNIFICIEFELQWLAKIKSKIYIMHFYTINLFICVCGESKEWNFF